MQVGDIMLEKKGPHSGYLVCGSGSYSHAILVSVEPFVMVSEEGDMMWCCAKAENFVSSRPGTPEETKEAFKRYKRELKEEAKA